MNDTDLESLRLQRYLEQRDTFVLVEAPPDDEITKITVDSVVDRITDVESTVHDVSINDIEGGYEHAGEGDTVLINAGDLSGESDAAIAIYRAFKRNREPTIDTVLVSENPGKIGDFADVTVEPSVVAAVHGVGQNQHGEAVYSRLDDLVVWDGEW